MSRFDKNEHRRNWRILKIVLVILVIIATGSSTLLAYVCFTGGC